MTSFEDDINSGVMTARWRALAAEIPLSVKRP
jgi:hypothetical protein